MIDHYSHHIYVLDLPQTIRNVYLILSICASFWVLERIFFHKKERPMLSRSLKLFNQLVTLFSFPWFGLKNNDVLYGPIFTCNILSLCPLF
jgi:hypothetical protein